MADEPKNKTRREFVANGVRVLGLLVFSGVLGELARSHAAATVWQIDPNKCTQCGKCATECVSAPRR